ncbi:hypothetical protein GTJ96_16290 [Escherichia coli]|uniref:hypothetical protein n=1 Tax=Escherichia coli TaxID=562 RepID=UPI0014332015|nr:hypothetical protein [Escherichia coli]NKA99753.1 hypothetical protein [Escherichia coli]
MNISYVNSNKMTSLPVELDALNNKDISYSKDFSYAKDLFLYIETQLKIAKDFCRQERKYQDLLQVQFFMHLLI